MIEEIEVAANFISTFLPSDQKTSFEEALRRNLQTKFQQHWYPLSPERGSAYRSITCYSLPDPLLIEIALKGAFSLDDLPLDLCVWIDPGCVSYRQGNSYVVSLWQTQPEAMFSQPERISVTLKHPNSPSLSPPKSEIRFAREFIPVS